VLKYKIIKVLDLAGLKVFEPVVKLAYWDEPEVQTKKIFCFIVVPVLAFLVFLGLWNFIAPRHTTKSGEVPTPPVVLDAWDGIMTFHNREHQKMADFTLTGEAREKALADVNTSIAEIENVIKESDTKLASLKKEQETIIQEKIAPIMKEFETKSNEFKVLQKQRDEEAKKLATSIAPEDKDAKLKLLETIKANNLKKDNERDILNLLKDQMNTTRSYIHEPTKVELTYNSALAAEKQYLKKRRDLLSDDNRAIKVESAFNSLENKKQEYLEASGTSLYIKAKSVLRSEESIGRIENSSYAKPWTFLDQIVRSLGCVFLGFAIATMIAIPIGILCGLNPIFMASMVPLISLFKPVSPIVWLPIVFIIVGGFIDDPDQAMMHPAFLSSAITVALCSLWPTLVNTALGVASIEKDYMNVAKVLKLGFWSRLFKIVIPSALPLIFAGLRISLGVGWMVLIAAELLSSSEGIGKFVWDMFNNGSSETFAQMFVVVFIVGIVGLLLDRVMIVLQRSVSFEASPSGL
jgi:nitrate/nitrite transport system permease protein